jgi:hypothetical protein
LNADIREALKADSGIAGERAVCKLVSKVLLDREFIAKHLTSEQCRPRKVLYWAIYGLAAGDTEMTNWRIHSPKRDRLTKLVRIEGRNVQRSNIKAA